MKINKMITLFAIIMMFSFFTGCTSKNPLTGIWISEDEGLFLAFIDDNTAFIGEYDDSFYDVETISEYTFEKETGIFNFYYAEFEMSLKNNILTLLMTDDPVEFTKINTEPAPKEIAGVWRGPKPWLFAFVNDKVFIIDRDGDFDYADFDFDKQQDNTWSGYFETEYFGWEIEFSIKDGKMTTAKDFEGVFLNEN